MNLIRNLFPEDTRIIEFCSSIILVISGIMLNYYGVLNTSFLSIQRFEFWSIYIIISGFIQFFSLIFYTKVEILRHISALSCGALLIWFGLNGIKFSISEISLVCIGVLNLYAFIINSAQVKVWPR